MPKQSQKANDKMGGNMYSMCGKELKPLTYMECPYIGEKKQCNRRMGRDYELAFHSLGNDQ